MTFGIPDPGRASKAVALIATTRTDQQSFTYVDQSITALIINGEPWFQINHICDAINIANPRNVAARLGDDQKAVHRVDTPGGEQACLFVNESGLYEIVIRSDKPEAVAFRRWVTGEVLPAIRRTGSYSTAPALTGAELFAHAVLEAQAMLAAKDERIAELEPKAEIADRLLDAEGDLSVGDTAQALTRAGIKTGRGRMFATLEGKTWIYRARGDGRYRVNQRAIDAGWMSVLPQTHYHPKTGELVLDPPQPRVTPKGLQRLLIDLGGVAA